MSPRLTVKTAAVAADRSAITIYRAVENGTLHGTQRGKGAKWSIRQECLDAWLDNEPCEHQAAKAAVTSLDERRAVRAARTTA